MQLRGQLKTYSLLPLLKFLHKRKLSGTLSIQTDVGDYNVHVREGMPYLVTTTVERDSFAAFLCQVRVLSDDVYQQMKNQAGITGRSIDEFVLRLGKIDRATYLRWRAVHIQKTYASLFSLDNASYDFAAGSTPPAEVQLALDPLLGFMTNVAKFPNLGYQREQLAPHMTRGLTLSTALIRGIRVLQTLFGESTVAPHLRNGITIRDVCQILPRDAVIPQVFALLHLGWIQFAAEEQVDDSLGEEEVSQVIESDASHADVVTKGHDLQILQALHTAHERVVSANYYDVLGVGKNFDPKTLSENYQKLIMQFHIDRFAKFKLDDAAKTKLNEILTIIGKAYNTLKTAEKRKEYEDYLEFKEQGVPTELGSIFQADESFERGVKLMSAGRAAEAHAEFEKAIELNSSDPEYYAYLGWSLFCAASGEDQARERSRAYALVHDSLRRNENLHIAYLFLGHMSKQEGRLQDALSHYNKSLALKKNNNIEAEREIRLINMRIEKQKQHEKDQKSMLGRFFKR